MIELPTKFYIEFKFDDSRKIKNTAHGEFSDEILENVRFINVNSMPAAREHLTPKYYVDHAIFCNVDESSLLRLDRDEKLNLDEQYSIVLNSTLASPKTIKELPTKSYVDSLRESSRNRRNLPSVFKDQDNEFDNNKLTNLDSVSVNREPSSDIELANKKHVDDSIGEGNVLGSNQTFKNYLKVSVRNDTYNITKNDKKQITNTTINKYPNTGGYLL